MCETIRLFSMIRLGLFHVKPGVPYPNLRLEALLDCIEWQTGLTLNVTSTNEPPPLSPHGPNDPHIPRWRSGR